MDSVPMWLWDAVYSETGSAVGSLLILFVGGGVCLLFWKSCIALIGVYSARNAGNIRDLEARVEYSLRLVRELEVRLSASSQEIIWLRKRLEDENLECERRVSQILKLIDANRKHRKEHGQV